ncbi:MAG: hypothetical protein GTN76_01480 [Candidatus Aenigmarchaeota archaeon]|nr:hypothetical protein [Candidatus Aenigmarchaeota archaeon]
MKTVALLGLIFLLVSLSNVNVCAQPSTGSTVINATVIGIEMLNLSLQYPEIVIGEDYYFFENLTLSQSNSQDISVYLNKSDTNNFVKFVNETPNGTYYQDDYSMFLPRYTYKNVTLRVYVPAGMGYDGGTYNVPTYAYSLSDGRWNTTTLKIHVNTTNPIDDIEIVNINPSSLYPGESLQVDISIHKIYPTETTDIQICYCINSNPSYQCGPAYNNYGCSWKAVTEWLNYTKTVTVNQNPGTYYFIVAVKYPSDENIKRANSPQFYVKSTQPSVPGGAPGPAVPPSPQLTITAPDYIEATPGEIIRFKAEIENTGNAKASSTSLDVYGIPEKWVSVTPHAQDIGIRESKSYSVMISLPTDAFEQVYSLSLVAKSGTVETTKITTLTVAKTLKGQAKFLLGEANSKKKEAEGVVENAKEFELEVRDPELILLTTDELLEEAGDLFNSGDYEESVEKAKQVIEGYKSVISSTKDIVENAYNLLLEQVNNDLKIVEPLTEERNLIESVNDKINKSLILQRQDRVIEGYQTLLDAKHLLDQLGGKIYFMGLSQNMIIISILVVVVIAVAMFLFYKKMLSKFLKEMIIEEQKRRLKHLFKREIKPGIPAYEGRPTARKEKLDAIWEKIKRKVRRRRMEL